MHTVSPISRPAPDCCWMVRVAQFSGHCCELPAFPVLRECGHLGPGLSLGSVVRPVRRR